MKRRVCLGCQSALGRNSDAASIRHTDAAGVTTEYTLCLPCIRRVEVDSAFSRQLDRRVAKLTGTVAA